MCDLINEKIKPETPLQVHDLDIAHPLPARNHHCPSLAGNHQVPPENSTQLHLREEKDLEEFWIGHHGIFDKAPPEAARSAFPWRSVWTMKGDVYDVFHNNRRQVIHDFDDINKIKSKPAYARAVSG